MKRGIIWLPLTCIMMTTLFLASCTNTTSTPTETSKSPQITTSTPGIISTTSLTTTTAKTVTSSITPSTGNWWDKLGKPQFGGTLTLRIARDITNFDVPDTVGQINIISAWMEKLFGDNWALDPAVYDYKLDWRPSDFETGNLAQSYEFTDPGTVVVHLRQGVHWQNIAPANGREFIAADVVFDYDRLFGLGDGFTKPAPSYATDPAAGGNLASVTASDKYTVVFKWSILNPEFILESMQGLGVGTSLENPDAAQLWGNLDDWHHAIGTGPFILSDFVSGSSATLIKNPNYWAYDERYPQNQLPYMDMVKFLIVPDNATSLAAVRTGKIDIITGTSLQDSQQMQKTNPEILRIPTPQSDANAIVMRYDAVPFKDIKVRQAMQLSLDLQTIAKSYYLGAVSPNPSSLTSNYLTGYGFPYDQWTQDLKDQYAYNPTMAKQLLATAGYPNGFNTNIVVDNASDLNLLQIAQSYFADIGIKMSVQTMDSTSWTAFVRTGHKYDQLAMQTGSDPLGLCVEPFRQLQRLRTGYGSNYTMVSDPVFDAFYTKALAANSIDGVKQVLKDANAYVAQQHFVLSMLQPMTYSLCQPWVKGYNGQADSVGGGLSNPLCCAFYIARFSIDVKLKNSLGH
jgi:peptide/nickel transport system substrate-binding protein